MVMSGKLSPNVFKPFGSASITTTIKPAWTPASGKVVVLMGAIISLSAGTAQVDLTDGTAAAAGTVATLFMAHNPGIVSNPSDISFGSKMLTGANTPLGIKARAGEGTVVATFYGREFVPA